MGEVVIAGQFGGFVFQRDEVGFQTNAAELISDHKLRAELNLKNEDVRIHSSRSETEPNSR